MLVRRGQPAVLLAESGTVQVRLDVRALTDGRLGESVPFQTDDSQAERFARSSLGRAWPAPTPRRRRPVHDASDRDCGAGGGDAGHGGGQNSSLYQQELAAGTHLPTPAEGPAITPAISTIALPPPKPQTFAKHDLITIIIREEAKQLH